jgi:hypothetical protein
MSYLYSSTSDVDSFCNQNWAAHRTAAYQASARLASDYAPRVAAGKLRTDGLLQRIETRFIFTDRLF